MKEAPAGTVNNKSSIPSSKLSKYWASSINPIIMIRLDVIWAANAILWRDVEAMTIERPTSRKLSAVVGFNEVKPGRTLFKLLILNVQPNRTVIPSRVTSVPAIRGIFFEDKFMAVANILAYVIQRVAYNLAVKH